MHGRIFNQKDCIIVVIITVAFIVSRLTNLQHANSYTLPKLCGDE